MTLPGARKEMMKHVVGKVARNGSRASDGTGSGPVMEDDQGQ
jgi:hypothetical protein